jgi:hypothetical protein
MLSYVLGMAFRFEREHGFSPNLLYLNQEHMRRLCAELGVTTALELSERLGLASMICPSIAHPQVVHLFQAQIAVAGN